MTCDAFVLGGGGVLGAAEVGMARALLEAGIRPDLVCGTSVGAINGAAIAADPTPEGARASVGDMGHAHRRGSPRRVTDQAGHRSHAPPNVFARQR